ncbi:MAG: hypothetical protein GVY30_12610 [Chloroflexi bacterium]|jgi:hypothetical protein|nr:hypothetical protein [Chloroflexota bacterium]
MNEKSDRRAIGHDPFADMEADGWEKPSAEEVAPSEEEEMEKAAELVEMSEAPPVASAPSPAMDVEATTELASAPKTETVSFTEVILSDWLFSDAAHPGASYPRLRDFPTSQEAAKLLHDWLHS